MKTHYAWRPGSRIGIDAQSAGRELSRLEKRVGAITPITVVDAARPSDNPLHDHFEWNDSIAAEEHRKAQARHLIQDLVVQVSHSNIEPPTPHRVYINVIEGEDQHYVSVSRAMSDMDLRKQVLERAWADLESWRRRYAELQEFAKVFEAIDMSKMNGTTKGVAQVRKRA